MKPDTKSDYAERILRVLVHIQQNLERAPGVEELARVAHFSPFHFHRIFRGLVGESVKQHVKRLRLERAALLLKSSDRPVTEIAFDAGYETHESFTRAFRGAFGCSPSEFRSAAASTEIQSPSRVHLASAGTAPGFHPISHERNPMQIQIKKLEPMKVAYIHHIGPYEVERVSKVWGELLEWAGPRGLFGPNTRMVGASYDDPEITPPDRLRYDACLCIDRDVTPEGNIGVQELGGGEYAVALHEGPYEKFVETYGKIFGWLPEQDRQPAPSACLEFYLNHPGNTAPEDLRTEVWVPLS